MLGVTWKSLWLLNAELPHPDFALQVLYCPVFRFSVRRRSEQLKTAQSSRPTLLFTRL